MSRSLRNRRSCSSGRISSAVPTRTLKSLSVSISSCNGPRRSSRNCCEHSALASLDMHSPGVRSEESSGKRRRIDSESESDVDDVAELSPVASEEPPSVPRMKRSGNKSRTRKSSRSTSTPGSDDVDCIPLDPSEKLPFLINSSKNEMTSPDTFGNEKEEDSPIEEDSPTVRRTRGRLPKSLVFANGYRRSSRIPPPLSNPPKATQEPVGESKVVDPGVKSDQPPVATFSKVKRSWFKKFPKLPVKYMSHRFVVIGTGNGRIEYDLDDEDMAWLDLYNEKRINAGENSITQNVLEHAINLLEKEAYQLSKSLGVEEEVPYDEDAVCCICLSGECENANAILFCDACNMAVHQECYGVPYIPEGQWLCRRCMHASSNDVSCALCPLKGGALKQTDDGKKWVHVLCALWIPELFFGSPALREPVFGMQDISRDRYHLTCYLCGKKHKSACIQCHHSRCYTAFHVTCAQQANLCMYIGPGEDGKTQSMEAYCHLHTPQWAISTPFVSQTRSRGMARDYSAINAQKQKQAPGGKDSTQKSMTIPNVSSDVLCGLLEQNRFDSVGPTAKMIRQFWVLKRRARRGVPLLRSLQDNLSNMSALKQAQVQKDRTKFQYVRMQLEKTRMLVGQALKRERIRMTDVSNLEQIFLMEAVPMQMILTKILTKLSERDTDGIFANPVDLDAFPDYANIIQEPMDISLIGRKLERGMYQKFDDFVKDYHLMCENALYFNEDESYYHGYALDMLHHGNGVLEAAGEFISSLPIDLESGRLLSGSNELSDIGGGLAEVFEVGYDMVEAAVLEARQKKEEMRRKKSTSVASLVDASDFVDGVSMESANTEQQPIDVSRFDAVEFMLLKDMIHARTLSRNSRTARFRHLSAQLRCFRKGTDEELSEKLQKRAGVTIAVKKQIPENKSPASIMPGMIFWGKQNKFPWHPAEVVDPDGLVEWNSATATQPNYKVLGMCPIERRGTFGDVRGVDDKKKYLLLWCETDLERYWTWLTKKQLRSFSPEIEAEMTESCPARLKIRVRGAVAMAEKQIKKLRAYNRQMKAKKYF